VKIKALLFDLGKVLVDFDFERGMRQFVSRTSMSRQDFEHIILDQGWMRTYESGGISTREFHDYLREHGKLEMSLEEFANAWNSVFLPGLVVPERLLSNLRENYPLILVSNTNESHIDYIAKNYPVLDYFNHIILSHEVRSMKPDRKIYDAAIAAAGLPPEALFFTDDRVENVASAAELGIRTHQFHSLEGLVKALQEWGVRVGDFVPS
jgi:putative hydrolase of the HAD superfamily